MAESVRFKAERTIRGWLTADQTMQLLFEFERRGLAIIDQKALRAFLDACGQRSKCAGCSADIWWFTARNTKRWPVTAQGQNHFIDCPQASDFKRERP